MLRRWLDQAQLLSSGNACNRMLAMAVALNNMQLPTGSIAVMTVLDSWRQVIEAGAAVEQFRLGDRVLVAAVTSCGKCSACRIRRMPSLCEAGGWTLGNTVDGTQARPLAHCKFMCRRFSAKVHIEKAMKPRPDPRHRPGCDKLPDFVVARAYLVQRRSL